MSFIKLRYSKSHPSFEKFSDVIFKVSGPFPSLFRNSTACFLMVSLRSHRLYSLFFIILCLFSSDWIVTKFCFLIHNFSFFLIYFYTNVLYGKFSIFNSLCSSPEFVSFIFMISIFLLNFSFLFVTFFLTLFNYLSVFLFYFFL